MEMTLGEKLRQLRNINNLTLREIEEKTKISNSYLNQLEQGKIKGPSPHILHKLADFYKIRYQSLLELAGYLSPSRNKRTHGKKVTGIAFSSINLTPEEEEELLKYLEFIRQKKKHSKL